MSAGGARASTRIRVQEAALALAGEVGFAGLTMEGIAGRAGAGKQTLYRSWPSVGAILFDALLARSQDVDGQVAVPDTGNLAADLEMFIAESIAELQEPTNDRLLRAATAEIQVNEELGEAMRDRLLRPQLEAVQARLERGGIDNPAEAAELVVGPVFHRWLLRTGPFRRDWPHRHVARVLRAFGSGNHECPRHRSLPVEP